MGTKGQILTEGGILSAGSDNSVVTAQLEAHELSKALHDIDHQQLAGFHLPHIVNCRKVDCRHAAT